MKRLLAFCLALMLVWTGGGSRPVRSEEALPEIHDEYALPEDEPDTEIGPEIPDMTDDPDADAPDFVIPENEPELTEAAVTEDPDESDESAEEEPQTEIEQSEEELPAAESLELEDFVEEPAVEEELAEEEFSGEPVEEELPPETIPMDEEQILVELPVEEPSAEVPTEAEPEVEAVPEEPVAEEEPAVPDEEAAPEPVEEELPPESIPADEESFPEEPAAEEDPVEELPVAEPEIKPTDEDSVTEEELEIPVEVILPEPADEEVQPEAEPAKEEQPTEEIPQEEPGENVQESEIVLDMAEDGDAEVSDPVKRAEMPESTDEATDDPDGPVEEETPEEALPGEEAAEWQTPEEGELVAEFEDEIEISIPDMDADNADELLLAYLEKILREAAAHPGLLRSIRVDDGRLNETCLALYQKLKPQIEAIAAGSQSSTELYIKYDELGLPTRFTAEELGLVVTSRDDLQEGVKLVAQQLKINYALVQLALLANCPYELYWYDKSAGARTTATPGMVIRYIGGQYVYEVTSDYTVRMTVSDDYSEDTYVVDTGVGKRVQHSVQTFLTSYRDL